MSWLSKATGIHLGNIGGPIGFGLGALIGQPGLGAALGQGVGALGSHHSLGQAAAQAGGAYLGSRALGSIGYGGGSSAGAGSSVDPNSPDIGNAGVDMGSSGGWLGNLLSGAGHFLSSPGGAAATNLVGGVLQGRGQGQVAQANRDFERELFNKNYALSSGGAAMGAQKSIDAAPLRDRAQYLINARMGMTPQSFQARDLFNPQNGSPSAGGYNPQQLQTAASSYTPGAGGVTTGVQQQLLNSIGYGAANQRPPFVTGRRPALPAGGY